MELNKVLLLGNLTRDPESRFLQNGSQVCKLGLASNRRYTANGEKREDVLFIDVEAWGKTAELCSQYLRKGSQVLVEGRLKMDQYQSKEGEKRTRFLIVAESVQFGSRPDGAAGAAPGGASAGRQDRQDSWSGGGRGEQARPASTRSSGSDDADGASAGTEDDLPF